MPSVRLELVGEISNNANSADVRRTISNSVGGSLEKAENDRVAGSVQQTQRCYEIIQQ